MPRSPDDDGVRHVSGDSLRLGELGFFFEDDSWLQRLRDAEATVALGAIGEYELIAEIARGGQGVVHRARQPRTNREIALKRLAAGAFATRAMRSRFEREIEAVSALDHPFIITVYGVDQLDGQLVLAMEWIDGEPVDAWSDRVGRDANALPRLLGLFLRICDAVQHAHERGVLHRDLKPSNLLVTQRDEPRVLDFGLARLVTPPDGGSSVTLTGDFLGTPAYSSPEQTRGDWRAIDTRTDVYALCVVLYRMLGGRLPIDPQRPLPELFKAIASESPLRPSALNPVIRRDLDTVILKGLSKQPAERYASVAELAADLRRYLAGEVVLAHPPSAWYQLRKLAARHRAAVVAAGLVLTTLFAATGVSVRFALGEASQRQIAEAAQIAAEEQAALAERRTVEARQQAAIARAVNDFLNRDLLAQAQPIQQPDRDIRLRTVLDNAARRIDDAAAPGGGFADKPLVEAEVRRTLSDTYYALSEYQAAEPQLAREVALRERTQGPDAPQTLDARRRLGALLTKRGDLARAEQILRDALLGLENNPDAPVESVLSARHAWAQWLHAAGRYPESLSVFERVAAEAQSAFGPDDPRTFTALLDMAALLHAMGRPEQAAEQFRALLERQRATLGPEHPDTLGSMNSLASALEALGRYDDALALAQEAVRLNARVLGPDHAGTLAAQFTVASLLFKLGRNDEALPVFRRVYEGRQRILGENHPATLAALRGMAHALENLNRFEEAEPYARQALELNRASLGPDHPATLTALATHGAMLVRLDRLDDAETVLRDAYDRRARVLGPDHPDTLTTQNDLAATLRKMKRYDEAEPLVRECLERRRRTLGNDNPATLYSLNTLSVLLIQTGRLNDAEPYARETVKRRRALLGDDHPSTLTARMNLAAVYDRTGRLEEALEQHLAVVAGRERMLAPDHPDTLRSHSIVGTILRKLDRLDEAAEHAAIAYEGTRRTHPAGHFGIGAYALNYGRILMEAKQAADAERLLLEAHGILTDTVGPKNPRTRAAVRMLVDLYIAWDAAEPKSGHAAAAAEWQARVTD